jgi:hypothetical protein
LRVPIIAMDRKLAQVGLKTPANDLAKLTPTHIQEAYNRWATGGRLDGKEGPLSPRTRRHIHRILRSALARAVENQLLARNPADVFKRRLPKIERCPCPRSLDSVRVTSVRPPAEPYRAIAEAIPALSFDLDRHETPN